VAIGGNGFIRYDNALESVGVTNNYGPLEIRSTNGALLAAVSQVSGLNRNTSGFFEAQSSDSSAETLILPYVVEISPFEQISDSTTWGSSVDRQRRTDWNGRKTSSPHR
jgi:hypothetical protein